MTSRELMDNFFSNPLYNSREYRLFLRIFLRYLTFRGYEVRLLGADNRVGDGDITNLPILLNELAQSCVTDNRHLVTDLCCPDCRHEHEGRDECGHYLGEGKFCKCPTKVLV